MSYATLFRRRITAASSAAATMLLLQLLLLFSSGSNNNIGFFVHGFISSYDDTPSVTLFQSFDEYRELVLESKSLWLIQICSTEEDHNMECKKYSEKYKALSVLLEGIINVGIIDVNPKSATTRKNTSGGEEQEGDSDDAPPVALDDDSVINIARGFGIRASSSPTYPKVYIVSDEKTDYTELNIETDDEAQAIMLYIKYTFESRMAKMTNKSQPPKPNKSFYDKTGGASAGSGNKKKSSNTSGSSSNSNSGGGGIGRSDALLEDVNGNNFVDKVMNNPAVIMLAFTAPWCGHCNKLKPEWDEAIKRLDGTGAQLAWIDAESNRELTQQFNVEGFPTIKVFPGGKNKSASDVIDYQYERSTDAIVRFLLQEVDKSGAPIEIPQLINQSIFDKTCVGSNRICVVAVLPHILDSGAVGRNKYIDILATVAKNFRGTAGAFHFLWIEGTIQPEFESIFGLTFGYPAMVAVSVDRNAYGVLRGAFNEKSISSFLYGVTTGRTQIIKLDDDNDSGGGGGGRTIPKIQTIEPWDGLDGEIIEEEFSLEDIMGDEL